MFNADIGISFVESEFLGFVSCSDESAFFCYSFFALRGAFLATGFLGCTGAFSSGY